MQMVSVCAETTKERDITQDLQCWDLVAGDFIEYTKMMLFSSAAYY